MRVLHMIGSLNIGGSQMMIMNIYRNIDREKIQFDFIVDHSEHLYFADEIEKMGGKIFLLPQFKGNNYFEIKKAWNNFFENHPEYKILHSHVRSYASLYIPVAKKYGIFTIIHSHSTSNGTDGFAFIKDLLQYPLRFQADYYMACSDKAGKWLFGNKIVKQRNYCIISNAIDTQLFNYNKDKREKVRKKLTLEGKFVIGHVGRMTYPKNHLFLIDVFKEICKFRDDAVLLLVGDGDLRYSIEKAIYDNELKDKVIILGNRSNTQDYYQAMDVFAFPSLWEGLGIVAIEAQTSGLPCVVSERIPKEMDLGIGLINVVSLEAGKKCWAKEILDTDIQNRTGRVDNIRKAGYDIKENALKIQKFYLNIEKK